MRKSSVINAAQIQSGDRAALARAITLAESTKTEDVDQIRHTLIELLPYTGNSIRLAVTGPPGAGKSTFIESFGNLLITFGYRVAVLSVDPSSSKTYGSILGDKTRMTDLAKSDHAFIRPSPSAGQYGGVAPGTREAILLCEAAGYDFIIIETVGVGQSEVAVCDMVDCFLLLLIAGAGDELQGLKKGIMEMADLIVINKNDGENIPIVKRAKSDLNTALRLLDRRHELPTEVVICSALERTGLSEVYEVIQKFTQSSKETGSFFERRKQQQVQWLEELLHRDLYNLLRSDGTIPERKQVAEQDILEGRKNIFEALKFILNRE